jgi:hypothetical protein
MTVTLNDTPETILINPEIQFTFQRLRELAKQDKPGKFVLREIDRELDDLETELKFLENPEDYADRRIAELTEDSTLIPDDIVTRILEYLEHSLEVNTWDMEAFNLKKDIMFEYQPEVKS